MSIGVRQALVGLALVCALTGCATVRAVWTPLAPQSDADRTLRRAERLVREGQVLAGRDLYERVALEYPVAEPGAEALYRLGLLQADPASLVRDYRAARITFTRLTEHPCSRWDAEARAWQATLTDLLLREDEARRATQRLQRSEEERRRTKMNLDRLKQTELELERRR